MALQRQAVVKSSITLGVVSIPVSVYKAVDEYGLPGELFHENCGAKVHQKLYCEELKHLSENEIQTFSAIKVDDTLVRIDGDIRSHLLDRDSGIQVVSSHKLSALPQLMVDDMVVVCGNYEVGPSNPGKPSGIAMQDALSQLLDRLRVKKRFLLVTAPLCGMRRFAILLPGGQLLALTYREEIRDRLSRSKLESDRPTVRYVDRYLDEIDGDFPVMTLVPYKRRFTMWLNREVKLLTASPKKKIKVKPQPNYLGGKRRG